MLSSVRTHTHTQMKKERKTEKQKERERGEEGKEGGKGGRKREKISQKLKVLIFKGASLINPGSNPGIQV